MAVLALVVVAPAQDGYVKVLSDMEDLSVWEGPCEATPDASEGKAALLVRMGKGGSYVVRFRDFAAAGIDLRNYDIIKFDYKVTGGRVTLDHTIRQWPFHGGYMMEYYPLKDTFVYPSTWTERVVNLQQPENVRGGFDSKQQDFEFRVSADADTDDVRLYLDNVRFVKRLIDVKCDIDDRFLDFGKRLDRPEGSLVYRYELPVTNRSTSPQTVRPRCDAASLKSFVLKTVPPERQLAAGATETFVVEIELSAEARKALPALTQERCEVVFDIPGLADTDYRLDLLPTVPFAAPARHPYLIATADHLGKVRQWVKKWGWAKQGQDLVVKRAEVVMARDLSLPAVAPRPEQPGDKVCPSCQDKTVIHEIADPLCLHRYQCLTCGRMLSPKWPMRSPGCMAWWADYNPVADQPLGHSVVLLREGTIVDVALAWQLTGDRKYAEKVAAYIRDCLEVVPGYPVCRLEGYSTFGAKTGSRVGNFFPEYEWCAAMAEAVDLIWDSGCLTKDQCEDFLTKVVRPVVYQRLRLENYMVHRVNQFTGGYALLADDAPALGFAVNGTFGFRSYLDAHILSDGFAYMAPQYQAALMGSVLPILRRYDNAGLDLYTDSLRKFFTVWYEWTDPDGNTPDLGDSTWCNYRGQSMMWYFEQGFAKYGDPRMAIPLQESMFPTWARWPGLRWEDVGRVTRYSPILCYGAEHIPRDKPDLVKTSHDYQAYGLLIFNQGQGDKQLWLAMPYGRPLGHGYPDKLHIEWWALGQKMAKKGGGYSRACAAPWWRHSLLENTLLVDQQCQRNLAGRVEAYVAEGPVQGARVVNDYIYPGTSVERSVMLYNGLIFAFDRLISDSGTHTYDFVYRNVGALATAVATEPSGPLGNEVSDDARDRGVSTGYAVLRDVRRGPLAEPLEVSWNGLKAGENVGVRLHQAASPADPAELILADGPLDTRWGELVADPKSVYREEAPMPKDAKIQLRGPMMIVRRQGQAASFFTILEPYRGSPRIVHMEPVELRLGGEVVPPRDGVAYRLTADGQDHLVMMCPLPGVKTYGGLRTSAVFNATPIGVAE